jgi:F-type H+/Na+-transporting ATPase subunit alpha
LKLDLAQYRDMQAFAMFASDLDAASRQQLTRGARLMELLKQGQYSPFPVENQVVSIWAGTNGYLDDVPVEDISRFEGEFLDHLSRKSSILTTLAQTNVLDDDTAAALKSAIIDFKKGFFGEGDNHLVGAGHEEHDAISEGDVDQEKIVKQKR